ncbi:unnamed protein product [Echinostoma caproni]|uniref:Prothymosin alpha-like n=1 Tax=Echinostoma caproni TaxID=27848 RepID=A0A183A1R4_9TREM|nr:unnamed protein product [Echinostoma caproni]
MDSVDAAAAVATSPSKHESKAEELKRKSKGDATEIEAPEKNGKEEPVVKKAKLTESVEKEVAEAESKDVVISSPTTVPAKADESGDKEAEVEAEKNGDEAAADGEEDNGEHESEEEEDDGAGVNGSNGDKEDSPKEETTEADAAEESKE